MITFFFVVDIFQVNQFDNNQIGLACYKNNYASVNQFQREFCVGQ